MARAYKFDGIEKQLTDLVLHDDGIPMENKRLERYKLQPTIYDRSLFQDIVDFPWKEIQKEYPKYFYKNGNIKSDAPLPLLAYWYFWGEAEAYITQDGKSTNSSDIEKRLLALSTVLFENFRLIVITLSQSDDAQVIFQTLNSGGKPLSAMDLVRNDVFHRASRAAEDQEALMEKHWSVFETPFWKAEQTQGRIKKPRIDFYLAHTLAAEQGKTVSLGELYSEYKSFVGIKAFLSAADELDVLTRYVKTYKSLVELTGDGPLSRLAKRLNAFDVSTAYPLIFVIDNSDVDHAIKERLFELVASYVIRRSLCHLTPKNYNNIFSDLASLFQEERVSLESFSAYFSTKKDSDTARFPTDSELREAIRMLPQYGSIPQVRLRLILEEMEFASRDKFSVNGSLQEGLSIEHILPQEWPEHWPLPNGHRVTRDRDYGGDEEIKAAIQVRDECLHRLGNLTLLTPPANTSAGNQSFEMKAERLRDSLLNLNAKVLAEQAWDEAYIDERANYLAALAIGLWPFP